MVLPILLGILLLLLLFGLVIALLIYIPMLPLFLPTWTIELFGDIHTPDVLPVLFGVIVVGVFAWFVYARSQLPAKPAIPALLIGTVFLLYGAALFGNVWEILQAEQQYTAQQASFFSTSYCKDHPTACLTKDPSYYHSQLLPALVAEAIWYIGLFVTYYGFDKSRWSNFSKLGFDDL
jgi:hypothetical protein